MKDMKRLVLHVGFAGLLALGACGNSDKADKGAKGAKAGVGILAETQATHDAVCACKTKECATKVGADEAKKLAKMTPEQSKAAAKAATKAVMDLNAADSKKLADLSKRTADCISKLHAAK